MQSKDLHRRAQQNGARVVELEPQRQTLQGRIRDLEDSQNKIIESLKAQVTVNTELTNLLRDLKANIDHIAEKLNGAR